MVHYLLENEMNDSGWKVTKDERNFKAYVGFLPALCTGRSIDAQQREANNSKTSNSFIGCQYSTVHNFGESVNTSSRKETFGTEMTFSKLLVYQVQCFL